MFKLSFPTFFLKQWEAVHRLGSAIFGFLHVTITRGNAGISRTRDMEASGTRDISPQKTPDCGQISAPTSPTPRLSHCPSCGSDQIVRRGFRSNTRERVQLYLCRDCAKTFTPQLVKGKHYPMEVVLEGLSYYNLGFSLERSCELLKKKFALQSPGPQERAGFDVQPSTLSNWIEESKELCRYHRYRPFAMKMFSPEDTVWTVTLAHRQLYRFRLHRAKIALIIKEDIRHQRFSALKDYLELVPGECPHQYFQEGLRASEAPIRFSKTEMIVRAKQNFANRLAAYALQGVKTNTGRHEMIQRFMLANDTVTVATEVPVYIRREDLAHMQTQLGFELYKKSAAGDICPMTPEELPRLITGHIDQVQIRNGQIHIMDYKPNAAKEKPIEQLTLYALALSRLTGLRLFEFKCAWFDEKDYFEFYPLHVVYKHRRGRARKRIITKVMEIPGTQHLFIFSSPNQVTQQNGANLSPRISAPVLYLVK